MKVNENDNHMEDALQALGETILEADPDVQKALLTTAQTAVESRYSNGKKIVNDLMVGGGGALGAAVGYSSDSEDSEHPAEYLKTGGMGATAPASADTAEYAAGKISQSETDVTESETYAKAMAASAVGKFIGERLSE